MEAYEIIEILNDWNFWQKKHETGIKRTTYLKKIKKLAETEQVIAITGVRRAGKSTIMLQYIEELLSSGIPSKNILYVNFEDVRFKELTLELLTKIYEVYVQTLQPTTRPYLFLDEVHKINGWEKFARTMHELKKAYVFVSGSNSKLLFGELATVLTGRHLDIEIYPLDLRELLEFNNININNSLEIISKKNQIKVLLQEYLEHGGFPLVTLQKTKKELLKTYFEDIISKDVIQNHTVTHISKLQSLAKFYLTNAGKRISFNTLAATINISLDTVERYSYYLEEAYLIYFLKKFSYSVKEQERTMSVVYAIDNGIKNVVGFTISKDVGWLYQNTAALALIRKYGKKNVFYWMSDTKEEVDFIVKHGTKIHQLIQICYSLEDLNTKKREINALLKASRELKCNNLFIITEDKEGKEIKEHKKIKYIPLWKWLLEVN